MITAYAIIQPTESPESAKAALESILTNQPVTSYEVTLQRADVNGYAFAVSAEETEDNLTALRLLFGEINVVIGSAIAPAASARSAGWQVAGSEGRFARENPPQVAK